MPVRGGKEIARELRKLPRQVRGRRLDNAVREGAKAVVEQAQINAPYRTGRLRNAITQSKDRAKSSAENSVYNVGYKRGRRNDESTAFYGGFVELGTARMAAQPYLRPALDQKAEEATRIITRALQEALKLR